MTYLHTNTTPSVNASTDQHPHLLFSLLVPQVSFTIYSMNVAVNIQNTTDGDTCGILWLNGNNPVLATNRSALIIVFHCHTVLLAYNYIETIILDILAY